MPRGIPNKNTCANCGEDIKRCKKECIGNNWRHTSGKGDGLHACWPLRDGQYATPSMSNRGPLA